MTAKDSRPEDDELSAREHAALVAGGAGVAAGPTVSYAELKQGLATE